MRILNQNLQEGHKKVEEKPVQDVPKTMSKAGPKGQIAKSQTKSVAVVISPKEIKKPRTTIKFSFTMDSFVIDLLNTISSVSTKHLCVMHILYLISLVAQYSTPCEPYSGYHNLGVHL